MFDFGLAKELHLNDLVQDVNNAAGNSGGTKRDPLYNMSGLTGSRRYMAPEVLLCRPYNLSADVYSFGILLWQVLSLEIPFRRLNTDSHERKVALGSERPRIDPDWPVQVRALIRDCWNADLRQRPGFGEVCAVLKGYLAQKTEEMNGMGGGDDSIQNRTGHMMERSQHSNDGDRGKK